MLRVVCGATGRSKRPLVVAVVVYLGAMAARLLAGLADWVVCESLIL